MEKITLNDPETKSADIVGENLERLKDLFPEAFTEGRVDFEVLKQILGGQVDDRDEKFGLNWHGKRRARQLALTPSTGTLRPCPEESVDWDTTKNLMIEGDNLEVLKLLQKSYAGKVKMIYIDPPYNTGKDFVYPDNFQDNIRNYLELTGQVDGEGRKTSSNSEASGRFHTDWLNMMYPRLKLARSLLQQNGVIFLSIGDQEVARLRIVLDDVFGEENFIANIVWQKKHSPQNDATNISDMHDHIVVYARQARQSRGDSSGWKRNKIPRGAEQEARYENRDGDPRGPWTSTDLTCNKTSDERPNLYYAIMNPHTNIQIWPSKTRVWSFEPAAMNRLLDERRLWWGKDGSSRPRIKIYRAEVDDGIVPSSWWDRGFAGDNQDARRELRALFPEGDIFDTPKPVSLISRMIEIATSANSSDIVMDFFAGSATSGHAVLKQNSNDNGNRRFVLVQLQESLTAPLELASTQIKTIADVSKERLRRAAETIRHKAPLFLGDLGFRVLKLDSSNIRTWEPDAGDLEKTLLDNQEHLKSGRSEQDILYELLLKLGLDLAVAMEDRTIAGKTVHSIGAGTLMVCLVQEITGDDVESLAQGIVEWHGELAPEGESQVVFRDSAFADDVAKTNLTAILQQHGLTNVRSI